jgi:PiT family inorganic phosphate transporter
VSFDYINGFHDTANAIATSVATRAIKPEYAILLSATANFVGAWSSASPSQRHDRQRHRQDNLILGNGSTVLMAALLGAIAWNLITWRLAIPSSSSHALIGGLIGGAWAAAGRRRPVGSTSVSEDPGPAVQLTHPGPRDRLRA